MATSTSLRLSARARSAGSSRIREVLALVDRADVLSLAGGLPAAEDLDEPALAEATVGALAARGPLGRTALQYAPTEGLPALRELLAARHGVGIDQVLVTAGAQQAIALALACLADPGEAVALEDPAYLGAVQAARSAGLVLRPVGGDAGGLRIDELDRLLAGAAPPRVVYVTASFHNPTGVDLAADRRRALAELCDRRGVPLVDDDPYGELRFAGPPPPSPAAGTALGVRIGSASKTVAPGLRVGWLVGPSALVAAAARVKQAADLHSSALGQLVVAELLADEAAHAARLAVRRARLARRADALVAAVDRHLAGRLQVVAPAGGMFCWGTTRDGTGADVLLERALAEGVAFVPGSAFAVAPGGHRCSLRLSFAGLDEDHLDEAVRRLARAWDRTVVVGGAPRVGAAGGAGGLRCGSARPVPARP